MKKKNIFKIGIIFFALIIGIIIIYNVYKNRIEVEYLIDKDESFYCEETYCSEKPLVGLTVISYGECEICNKKMEFSDSNKDKLCSKCSKKLKRCKYCGKQLTD